MLTLSTLGISISNTFNAMYVDTVNTNYINLWAHNFLVIQLIFNPKKSFGKLRLRAFQPYNQILYMLTLLTPGISISNAFNAMYVNTVDTNDIHTFLPITFLGSHHNSFFCICQHCQQTKQHTKFTIHNSIALILCIDHLNMPFNVHTTDKVTVSGFLTI